MVQVYVIVARLMLLIAAVIVDADHCERVDVDGYDHDEPCQ